MLAEIPYHKILILVTMYPWGYWKEKYSFSNTNLIQCFDVIIDKLWWAWSDNWQLTIHYTGGLLLTWLSNEIIYKITSSTNLTFLNIDHKYYPCQFTLSYYVQIFIQWQNGCIMIVDISYQKILILVTMHSLHLLQRITSFFNNLNFIFKFWFSFLMWWLINSDGYGVILTVEFTSSRRSSDGLYLKCNGIEDIFTKKTEKKKLPIDSTRVNVLYQIMLRVAFNVNTVIFFWWKYPIRRY